MMKLNKIKNIKFYKLLYYTFLFLYFGYYIIIISSNYGSNVSSTTIKFLRYFIYAGFILEKDNACLYNRSFIVIAGFIIESG